MSCVLDPGEGFALLLSVEVQVNPVQRSARFLEQKEESTVLLLFPDCSGGRIAGSAAYLGHRLAILRNRVLRG